MTGSLLLFCASCGLLLGSAMPPRDVAEARAAPEAVAALRASPVATAERTPASEAPPAPPAEVDVVLEPSAPVAEARPPADAVRVLVSLPQQRAYVFRAGALIETSPVSTGRRGHETPIGRFKVLQKKVHHRSNLYANAPMPYMQRLTWSGIALHAGALPGYPASHGCIRLPSAFARRLYGMTNFSSEVTVTSRAPASWQEARELL